MHNVSWVSFRVDSGSRVTASACNGVTNCQLCCCNACHRDGKGP